MPQVTTEDKSNAALLALNTHYQQINGATIPPDEMEDALTDLIADLQHYAARNGLDFEYSRDLAQIHFEKETRLTLTT